MLPQHYSEKRCDPVLSFALAGFLLHSQFPLFRVRNFPTPRPRIFCLHIVVLSRPLFHPLHPRLHGHAIHFLRSRRPVRDQRTTPTRPLAEETHSAFVLRPELLFSFAHTRSWRGGNATEGIRGGPPLCSPHIDFRIFGQGGREGEHR